MAFDSHKLRPTTNQARQLLLRELQSLEHEHFLEWLKIKMVFGNPNTQNTSIHPYTETPLFLISGLGRSGTTVLRNCIHQHPSIAHLNRESNYLHQFLHHANLFVDDKFSVQNLPVSITRYWELHHQFILNLLWPIPKPLGNKSAIATYSYLDPRGAIGLQAAFQSKATVCFIIRNGIEVVSSYQSFKNFQHLSFEEVCDNWRKQAWMFQYCNDHDDATLVRHEWLRNDQDSFVKALTQSLARIGLDFDQRCLKPLAKNYHPTVFQGESKSDAKNPSKRNERWKLWDDEQKRTFKEICGESMELVGYEIPW